MRNGVLLINLGTPAAPTAPAIRSFLREFLSDRRVVPFSPFLWWPVLYAFVLPFRPVKLVPAYKSIFTDEGSPLLVQTRRLADALRKRLPDTQVAVGMRYGWPTVASAIKELELNEPERLLVFPMYPQYSRTTTASALDAVNAAMKGRTWVPEFRIINDYYKDAGYIDALRQSVEQHWAGRGRGDKLVMSFHGIPASMVAAGDPYQRQCETTAQKLAGALGLDGGQWQVCYQSRVGGGEWTGPYTEDVLRQLGASTRTVDVICPGFAADCIETLEEISIRGAETYKAAGGESLRYIPALNDSPSHADLYARMISDRLKD